MDSQEYYRLYPELRRRDWYTSLPTRAVMNYIVRNAFAEPCRVFDIDLHAGSLITFYSYLAEATDLNFWRVKDALNQLIDEGDISLTPFGHNIIVTLTHFPAQTQPKELTGTEGGEQYIAAAQPEQTFTTESTVPESSPAQPKELNGSEVGTQYIAPTHSEQTFTTESTVPESSPAQPKELNSTEVGAQYIAPAHPEQSKNHSFATSSSAVLPPRKSHNSSLHRRKAPKKSRIRGDTIVGTGVSPCKSTTNLHKPRSGDIFIRSPSY